MAGAGVAPGLSKIAHAFPDVNETMIKMILSAPPFFMIFASLISGKLSNWIKKRVLLLSGLLLFLMGGICAGYTNSFTLLLIYRAILGIGTGMILPFSTGLIGECYSGLEKTKMLGFSFAANNLGAIIANLIAGMLAVVSWRFIFNIYWIGLPVILLVFFFLVNLPEGKTSDKVKSSLPLKVYELAFFAFIVMIIFFAIVTNISLLINEKQIGTTKLAGIVLSINAFTMLIAGSLLSKTQKILKRNFLPVALLFVALGFWGIACSQTAYTLIFFIIVTGLGIGSIFPFLLNNLSESVKREQNITAMAIGMSSAWMGQFLSPIILDNIAQLFHRKTFHIFQGIAFIMLLSCIFTFVKLLLEKLNVIKSVSQER